LTWECCLGFAFKEHELTAETMITKMAASAEQNYYETLQLSPAAEQLVITKVYRLLAAYYHPDNKQTGDEERFKQILKAYEILSDPAKRSRSDLEFFGPTQKARTEEKRSNLSQTKDSLKSRLGNLDESRFSTENDLSERDLRKFMLLALYDVRRNNPGRPELSLLVLSELFGCTADDLEFSSWYLKEKVLIKISESADFSITVAGVDYVEKELLKVEREKNVLSLPEGRR
jgi:curved DNA-binding protein CbpA